MQSYVIIIGTCFDPIDSDGDGIGDRCDNCPDVNNPDQEDSEGDGWGNMCDNCPDAYNPGQENDDGDANGNLCDPDIDNDGRGVYTLILRQDYIMYLYKK